MSIFEAGMLFCFGLAWPINLINSYRSRTAKGKNPLFTIVVIIGYLSGITHKLIFGRDIVLVLYIINLIMITADLCLYFRNRKLDKEREATEK